MSIWGIVLKAVASLGLIYGLLIPLLRHHYVMNLVDGIEGVLLVIIGAAASDAKQILVPIILVAGWIISYAILYGIQWMRHESWFVLFNLMPEDYLPLKTSIMESIPKIETTVKMTSFHWVAYPFLQIKPSKPSSIKPFIKPLENEIKTKKPYPFWLQYGCFLLSFVLLIMIWRY